MNSHAASPSKQVDLTTCDRELIHCPGLIQPHGVLLAIPDLEGPITFVSANTEAFLKRPLEDVLGGRLRDVLAPDQADMLIRVLQDDPVDRLPRYLCPVRIGGQTYNAVAHRFRGPIILELEPCPTNVRVSFAALYPLVSRFTNRLQDAQKLEEFYRLTVQEVRRLTGFDRALIYQFDEQFNGTVVAEDRNDRLPSYLDLRFPAADIPRQARELYRVMRTRLIVDTEYEPVPIVAASSSGDALDLTYSTLRSVSPVHVEYMRNMDTPASMSISIVQAGRLWGLICCHHHEPRFVPFEVRAACDSLGQVVAMQLSARQSRIDYEKRLEHRAGHTKLLAQMAGEPDFMVSLAANPQTLLDYVSARGAAIVTPDRCTLVGRTPDEDQVRALADWLFTDCRQEVYSSHMLAQEFPAAKGYQTIASGLLAVSISQIHAGYLMWFRPEVKQTVTWGGDPRKVVDGERISPRKSFEAWKDLVSGQALAWSDSEVEAASDLRNSIVGIVLRAAEERAELTSELERSNKELEAFSYSVSHDLRAPFRHIVGFSELLREQAFDRLTEEERRYIDTVISSAEFAGALVDNLLTYSRMGRSKLDRVRVDMNKLVQEVRNDLSTEERGRQIDWHVDELPNVQGDLMMLRLAVQNLLANALKYTRDRAKAVIQVTCERHPGEYVFAVCDNGVGFDMDYVEKLFGVFQRLHRSEEFEGTGIGLANVRRIVARHGGRTWAEGRPGEGASFFFTLPTDRSSTAG
jgi:light-regulated signal transduction histidine kinase (bacteriophytochrome)